MTEAPPSTAPPSTLDRATIESGAATARRRPPASGTLFRNPERHLIQLNIAAYDAVKHSALPLVADAQVGLAALGQAVAGWSAPSVWTAKARRLAAEWNDAVAQATAPSNAALPSDAQVLGAVNRAVDPQDVIVCAAGGLPGELHKLWRCRQAGTYHVEYGYSCMGAIPARPARGRKTIKRGIS
jgi:3D-(3,5/4)-trihydroxycyclohexane-1,2-dione acylhydrolase (decyclizing)